MAFPISVSVKTNFVKSQSKPHAGRFVYAYTITIKNIGDEAAQLLTRHWIITDSNNKIQEVKGDGVIGEQPRLNPGQEYQYTSGVILETESGTMEGSYQMKTDQGALFDAPIPTFALVQPHAIH